MLKGYTLFIIIHSNERIFPDSAAKITKKRKTAKKSREKLASIAAVTINGVVWC